MSMTAVRPNFLKGPSVRGLGAALERLVFYKSKDLFRSRKLPNSKNDQSDIGFCWWTPPQRSILVEFCQNSTIHGLVFIGKSKLHLSERIFWTIALILGVVGAVLLIYDVWKRYIQNPVIVSFQPTQVDIDSIPFPSVSLCSINAFPKSKVKQLQKAAKGSGQQAKTAKEFLKYVRSICNTQRSFAKQFHFAFSRGEDDSVSGWNETITDDSQDEMIDFLLEHTISCDDLIRLCILGEKEIDCHKIFKPIITDYGKCCSFNILPLPLLLNNPQAPSKSVNESIFNPALGSTRLWSEEELNQWKKWNYDKDGFILKNKNLTKPFRQKRAGVVYGLSILIDSYSHESYCPGSDSDGFRFLLHNPLDLPRVSEFASLIEMDKEFLIKINPVMTNANDDIRQFDLKDRNCYFPEERQLKFFGPYTGGNCLNECTSLILERQCNCTYLYLPRDDGMNICNTDEDSKDFACIDSAKIGMLETLKKECKHCDTLCVNIEYRFESTMASLQNPMALWGDPDPEHFLHGPPSWARNKMSIIHIFMGSESIVPKLRKRLHGTVDLIGNTGGLLGLCLGFSVLSAIEIAYFLTLRMFWKFCRRRMYQQNISANQKISDTLFPLMESSINARQNRVIYLKPSQIPLLSLPPHAGGETNHYRRHHYQYPPPLSKDLENRKKLS